MAVLGPYAVAEYKAGNYVLLEENTNYWRHDSAGRQLPYIQSVRVDIQSNRDNEMLKLVHGEIDFINSLDAEYYDKLMQQNPALVHDSGVSLDSEQMWFNQVPSSPLPDYKKAWFASTHFRRAISASIHRDDIARVVFKGHARAQSGRVPTPERRLARSRWPPGRVLHHHQRRQQGPRAHGHHDSAGPGRHRHSPQRGHTRLPIPHRTHHAHLQLRSLPAGTGER